MAAMLESTVVDGKILDLVHEGKISKDKLKKLERTKKEELK